MPILNLRSVEAHRAVRLRYARLKEKKRLDTYMDMEKLLYFFLPLFVAAGSALLSFYVMQMRLEVALAKERETLAEARAIINSQKVTMEEKVKTAEASSRRVALDEFMQDFRVEERSYMRESKSLNALRKSMIMQERLFFRNIPLSNWIEREMLIEEGRDLDQLQVESIFTTGTLASDEGRLALSKLLDDFVPEEQDSRDDSVQLIPSRLAAFGLQ